jgi:hypothetical protein
MSAKLCQCGATPRFRVVRVDRKLARRSPMRERLACPQCGNATAPGKCRELLKEEWNTAGWCGQGELVVMDGGAL